MVSKSSEAEDDLLPVRSMLITTEHLFLQVTHNSDTKLDADYRAQSGRNREIEINMRDPRPMSVSATLSGDEEWSGVASVNWNTQRR